MIREPARKVSMYFCLVISPLPIQRCKLCELKNQTAAFPLSTTKEAVSIRVPRTGRLPYSACTLLAALRDPAYRRR